MNQWNISAWSIKRPVPSIVLFLILSIIGIYAYFQLGIDENPNIDIPTVNVIVAQPGAAPNELQTQITRPIEDAVAGIGNIKHIISTVNEGLTITSIQFELGTSTDRAVNDVRDAVTRIRTQLPQNINEPIIQRLDFTGGPFVTYTVSSTMRNIPQLSWMIDNDIGRQLMSVSGVGQVQRAGGVDREIEVDLDPTKLEAIGATADSVSSQIRALNINLPGGTGQVGGQQQSIRTLGSAETVQQLGESRIALPNGGWAALKDVGTINDSASEPTQMAYLDGKPVVALQVVRSTGSNLVQVAQAVDKKIIEIQKGLPPDVKITKIRSNEKYVIESYEATIDSLLIGAALAVAVIWLALRDWRSALIAATAMPLSMVPTFGIMWAFGYTLNNMSLLGLALVIGILVDDAIVEIENIVRHIHMGKSPYDAAVEAADEIGLAVVATTATIIVVFVPVAFMGGIPGQFFKQFGITVAVAVFFSLLVARLVTPMMAAYLLRIPKEDQMGGRLMAIYDRMLAWALSHRGMTVGIAGVIFCVSVALMATLPTSLIPAADRGETILSLNLPPGSSIYTTSASAQKAAAIVQQLPEVQHVFTAIGTASAGRGGAVQAASIEKANLYIILKPREERKRSQQHIEEALRPLLKDVPGARLSFGQSMGLGGRVQILLAGSDPNQLNATATSLEQQMRGMHGLLDVASTAALRSPQILVAPDEAKAAEQGVSVASIARTAMIATIGDVEQNLAKFDLPERQINIRTQIDPAYRKQFQALSNLRVQNSTGQLVPLSSVATIMMGSGPAQVDRFDRQQQVTITGTLQRDYTLGEALKDIRKLAAYKAMPAGVKELPTGDVEIQRDIFTGFGAAIGAAVLFIYAVLVLLFNDFLQPFTIMMSLPMALGGAALGLILFHQPLGMYALIGIVMLMGLVTKNAILLVEYCLLMMHSGMTRDEAIVASGEARMRPILMTTVAMVVGMVPIAMGLGAGSEVRSPMAVSVIGGLITSTFLTLILVPVVFTYIDDFRERIFAGALLHRRKIERKDRHRLRQLNSRKNDAERGSGDE